MDLKCRTCNKGGHFFCDVTHEAIEKIVKMVPGLINIHDKSLQNVTKICTTCYQMIKTIIFQLENIMDTQKILKIENKIKPSTYDNSSLIKTEENIDIKPLLLDDITKKYSNTSIKLKRISQGPTSNTEAKSPPKKIIIVEETTETTPGSKLTAKKSIMCIKCSNKFETGDLYQDHLETCKDNLKYIPLFKCFCGKVFKSQNDLNLHVSIEHKNNKQKHTCPVCKKELPSAIDLRNHAAVHKSNSPKKAKITCKTCNAVVKDLVELKTHKCRRKESES